MSDDTELNLIHVKLRVKNQTYVMNDIKECMKSTDR